MAILLSFICPGLGHLYVGRPVQGVLFFVLTVVGYACFVVPGICLHLFTMWDANRASARRDDQRMQRQAELMAKAMRR